LKLEFIVPLTSIRVYLNIKGFFSFLNYDDLKIFT
jgi:hypothetical protein